MAKRVRFSMLENGLDFLRSSLVYLKRATPQSLKYAVLHLHAGIAIIFKARVARQDWRLIFKKPKPELASETLLESGEFISINLDKSVEILEAECNVGFDEPDEQKLSALRKRRNRIEHHALDEEMAAIESIVIQCLNIIVRFVNREFQQELGARESRALKRVREKLEQSERVVQLREQAIAATLKEKNPFARPLPCPSCLRETLKADPMVECYYCGFEADASDAALRYSTILLGDGPFFRAKWAPTPVAYRCPECEYDSLVHVGEGGSDASVEFLCFNCGYDWTEGILQICPLCDQPSEFDMFGGERCRDCLEDYINQDYT